MKKLIVLLVLLALCGCQETAITGGGSSDGDALVSIGKVVSDKAEVGITGVAFHGDDVKTSYAVGPYAVYLIPTPEDIGKDWQPFAGGAMLFSADTDFDAIPKIVGGIIYKPQDRLSPVYIAEKAFPSGSVDSPGITDRGDDVYHWVGLRYRF